MMKKERLIGISFGFLLLCSSLAVLFIQAKKGNLIESILVAGLSWAGYIIIHKSETGKLVDFKDDIESNDNEKRDERDLKTSLIGPAIFTGGMLIGSRGVIFNNYGLAFVGASGVIGGYALFHYHLRGSLF